MTQDQLILLIGKNEEAAITYRKSFKNAATKLIESGDAEFVRACLGGGEICLTTQGLQRYEKLVAGKSSDSLPRYRASLLGQG